MGNNTNILGTISNGTKNIAQKAKKTVRGASNTVNDIKSSIGKVEQSYNIVTELALLDVELLRIENFEFPTEKNKINNSLQLTDEEKQEELEKLDRFYNTKLENLKIQKESLKSQYDKLNDNFFGLKKNKDVKDGLIKSDEKDEKLNNVKNKLKYKPTFTDIVSTISFILSTLLEFISINNSKIEELIDSTNEIISKAQTKEEIESARILRNRALDIINNNKQTLQNVEKITNLLELLTTILNPLINVLSLLPPLFITGATIRILTKLEKLLNDISSLLIVSNTIISKLIDNLNYQESRLLQVGDILDANISNLNDSDINNLLNLNRTQLGYLSGYDYKGFRFYLKEENDSRFNVKGNKRKYAVALNKDGNEVLQSKSSFTLDPDVLVEELKLQIDQKGLVA
jgi:hypothetical protein